MKNRNGRQITATVLALLMASLMALSAFAATSGYAALDEIEYKRTRDGNGYVSVELRRGSFTNKTSVKVTDSEGKSCKASLILGNESDEATIKVSGVKQGEIYSFTLSGVKGRGTTKTYTLSSTFKAIAGMETHRGNYYRDDHDDDHHDRYDD